MERRSFGRLAALVAGADLMASRDMTVVLRDEEPMAPPEPRQPRCSVAPSGGRVYRPNGSREVARRLRRLKSNVLPSANQERK